MRAASPDLQALINAFDWEKTAAGAISTWPAALSVTVRLMLASHVPMVMLIGPKGVLVYNDAYAVFAGARHPDLLGKEVAEGWPEIADLNLSILAHVLSGKTLSLRDQPMTLNRNGTFEDLWLDLDYSPVLDEDGSALAELVIVRETTTRVNVEGALARSEESLSFALAASGMLGLWDWDVTSDLVTSDSRFATMFGVDPDEAAKGVPIRTFVANVHPDDKAVLEAAIDDALRDFSELRVEYRLRDAEGGERWVLALGWAMRGEDGSAVRLPGVVVDITESKTAQEVLAVSEA